MTPQELAHIVLLSLTGGLVGVFLKFSRVAEIELDTSVLAFAILLSLLTGLISAHCLK